MSNANQNVADYRCNCGWSEFRLRPEFVDKFTQTDIDGNGDKRCKFFTNGQSKDVTSMTDETTGYLSEKWSNLKDDGTTASNTANDGVETDFPLFRLADVYLMYAECVVRLVRTGITGLVVVMLQIQSDCNPQAGCYLLD